MASFCIPAHLYALPRCNAFLFAPLKGVYGSTVVQHEVYWLRCQRYIELNPCALVWSVTLATIDGQALARTHLGLARAHQFYLALGTNHVERQDTYWQLSSQVISTGVM